jgi:hypothetical protein
MTVFLSRTTSGNFTVKLGEAEYWCQLESTGGFCAVDFDTVRPPPGLGYNNHYDRNLDYRSDYDPELRKLAEKQEQHA